MSENQVCLTWQDFPDFYNNPLIKRIAANQRWTVSDKNKRPIDMYALINMQKIYGMSLKNDYNPMLDLKSLCDVLPNATNNAYYLDVLEDKFIVLDVEPKCPDDIKTDLLKLPYIFGETSMSGKGYHLLFEMPDEILNKYPNAKTKIALKEEHGYYEILMNHIVTFTRNSVPPQNNPKDITAFYDIFDKLASAVKTKSESSDISSYKQIDINSIPYTSKLLPPLVAQIYGKKASDFHEDMSRYEFGMASFYYHKLHMLLNEHNAYKDHVYTPSEQASIIFYLLKEKLEYRSKHDQTRNGMPWLLYVASTLVATKD